MGFFSSIFSNLAPTATATSTQQQTSPLNSFKLLFGGSTQPTETSLEPSNTPPPDWVLSPAKVSNLGGGFSSILSALRGAVDSVTGEPVKLTNPLTGESWVAPSGSYRINPQVLARADWENTYKTLTNNQSAPSPVRRYDPVELPTRAAINLPMPASNAASPLAALAMPPVDYRIPNVGNQQQQPFNVQYDPAAGMAMLREMSKNY